MTKSGKRLIVLLSVLAFQVSLPMWLEKSPEIVEISASCTAIVLLIALAQFILGED